MDLVELAASYNSVSKAVPKPVANVINRLDRPFFRRRMARQNEAMRLRDLQGADQWTPGMKMGTKGYSSGYKRSMYATKGNPDDLMAEADKIRANGYAGS